MGLALALTLQCYVHLPPLPMQEHSSLMSTGLASHQHVPSSILRLGELSAHILPQCSNGQKGEQRERLARTQVEDHPQSGHVTLGPPSLCCPAESLCWVGRLSLVLHLPARMSSKTQVKSLAACGFSCQCAGLAHRDPQCVGLCQGAAALLGNAAFMWLFQKLPSLPQLLSCFGLLQTEVSGRAS